jgi:hypothetical protein
MRRSRKHRDFDVLNHKNNKNTGDLCLVKKNEYSNGFYLHLLGIACDIILSPKIPVFGNF